MRINCKFIIKVHLFIKVVYFCVETLVVKLFTGWQVNESSDEDSENSYCQTPMNWSNIGT